MNNHPEIPTDIRSAAERAYDAIANRVLPVAMLPETAMAAAQAAYDAVIARYLRKVNRKATRPA